jgi:DNA-binding transcriptional MerR regulator
LEKAPEAFRTISEVAQDLDLPQHVLRFWESRFAQIKPLKRGGGRRYYRPEDVDLLRGIRHLLYGQGYTIRGVQRILKDRGVRFVQTVWQTEANNAAGSRPQAIPGELEEPAPEPLVEAPTRTSPKPADPRAPERLASPRPSVQLSFDGVSSDRATKAGAPSAQGPNLRREDIQKLKGILHELDECRRLLDSALAGRG